ncbi:MAG: DUF523 domain-containing protein [Synergistaceae bacterium]|nr:DUF523 domain-containing protein [Synergistaceae bacterium]
MIKIKILVSACLLGINCRYCGGGALHPRVAALAEKHCLIPLCPEQLGGLPTPRLPCELRGRRVIDKSGADKTEAFERGAAEALKLARLLNCRLAILKERSPSCGSSVIYDGSFSGSRIAGAGITAALLADNGVEIFSEENIEKLEGRI